MEAHQTFWRKRHSKMSADVLFSPIEPTGQTTNLLKSEKKIHYLLT